MGEMGKMEENGGKWGGNVGHSTRDVGCGGLWRDAAEEVGQKGRKWEKTGTKYPFFTVPFSPFSRRSKSFPTVSFVKKNQLTALTDGKVGIFATHGHSPPRRLVRMPGRKGNPVCTSCTTTSTTCKSGCTCPAGRQTVWAGPPERFTMFQETNPREPSLSGLAQGGRLLSGGGRGGSG